MSDRITKCFAKAKAEGRGAFVSYLTMGYPTLRQSEDAVDDLVAGGVDIVELGVPFSDPFADGAVIRSAAYKALENGVTLDDVLAAAKRIRAKHPETALVVFTYYNLIFSKGLEAFAKAAADADIDAVLSEFTDQDILQLFVFHIDGHIGTAFLGHGQLVFGNVGDDYLVGAKGLGTLHDHIADGTGTDHQHILHIWMHSHGHMGDHLVIDKLILLGEHHIAVQR